MALYQLERAANLRVTNLSNANLSAACLENADFSGANLSRTYFRKARLSGANLSNANLSGAVLSDADDVQPGDHGRASGNPAASAFTAALAIAEPPRRPLSATNSQPRGSPASSALLSAAPTNPTGNPRITAGLGQP